MRTTIPLGGTYTLPRAAPLTSKFNLGRIKCTAVQSSPSHSLGLWRTSVHGSQPKFKLMIADELPHDGRRARGRMLHVIEMCTRVFLAGIKSCKNSPSTPA